jgi:polar amino acid transport system substrate-binding protein
MMGKMRQGRVGLLALLLLLGLMLAGCGAETPTSVPAATDTPAAAVATDTPAAAAPTNTAEVLAPTEAATTPTEMAVDTATAGTAAGAPAAGATPVSDWKPGAHAKSIPAPAKLVAPGTLTVGSDASYPPQEYIDPSGKAVGMDIDIAEEIASRLGLNLKVVNFKFDDIIPALNAGQFDMVISAMTVTDDRKKVVDFVPYFDAGQAVLVAKGNPKGIKTLDDLSGKTAAAEQGTTEEATLKDLNDKLTKANKPKVNILTYPTDTDAVDQLRVGRADATLHDSPVAAYYAKLNPSFEVAIPDYDSAPEGIATAKNNKSMFDAVNAAIMIMKSDGSLDAIKGKWGVK